MITENARPASLADPRSAVREFIASLMLCDDVLPVPITAEDAAYDMSNWAAEDIDLPTGMTPELYAETWNEIIMEV